MVWEYRVQAIVMLTKCTERGKVNYCMKHTIISFKCSKLLQNKCFQYWPETLHGNITPGNVLKITFSSSTPYAEYEVRKFRVKTVSSKYVHQCYLMIMKSKFSI